MKNQFKKLKEKIICINDKVSGYSNNILVKLYQLPDGNKEVFSVSDDKDSVEVFPMTSDHKVITVTQYRPGLEMDQTELPGGGIEPGEDPKEAAERELKEETGFVGDLIYLCKISYNPYSTGTRHLFCASNCKKVDSLDLDENEFLNVKLWSLNEFMHLARKGLIRGLDTAYRALDEWHCLLSSIDKGV